MISSGIWELQVSNAEAERSLSGRSPEGLEGCISRKGKQTRQITGKEKFSSLEKTFLEGIKYLVKGKW